MAPWIKNGQVADVTLEAFTDRVFRGKVWRISPTVDQAKRTFVVEALIDNPAGELKPGSYARAKLPTDKSEEIRLIPARAINYVFGSNKAYVIKGNVIETRDVKVGDRYDADVEIIEGLKEGESVATSQLTRLDNGTRVSAEASDKKNAD
jgi:membrane fusion protein (multidrug efflux system)